MIATRIRLLHRLARLYGVETVYRDSNGRQQQAAPCSILAVLRALGAPLAGPGHLKDALREHKIQQWQRCLEPVTVAWDGKPVRLKLHLPAQQMGRAAACKLEMEDGRVLRWHQQLDRLTLLQAVTIEGVSYESRQFTLCAGLPPGYHRFRLDLPVCSNETLIISAPSQAYTLPAGANNRLWGCFLPLYALHSRRSWGSGDFTDLETLLAWLHSLGGNLVGTLPLLAAFLDKPFAPSPYEPVSRLFWNEFYLDLTRIKEVRKNREARELLSSAAFRQEVADLRAAPLVDYRRGMALKRKILEICARSFFAGKHERQAALQHWLTMNPAALDYARFRATVEQRRAGWPQWPERMRTGNLRPGDYHPQIERYHLYVQWLAHEQLRELTRQAQQKGQRLYLDLPLGVHPCGYDAWRQRNAFALEASGGSPPDAFFTRGQDWGIAPLHPQRIREQGYRYFIACLRHHLQHAGILRLDHVMGLHRLYWVPRGLTAREGVYVHYHAEEFYAILTLESQRHQALLVGEDLGTVPVYVRKAMERHNLSRMYVLPFEYTGKQHQALRPVSNNVLACLNTHDMLPFAASWRQKGSLERAVLPVYLYGQGHLKVATSRVKEICRACLAHLAASPAALQLINLEDLWLENEPQNVPGTIIATRPNWRRKTRYALEEFTSKAEIVKTLLQINRLRATDSKFKT